MGFKTLITTRLPRAISAISTAGAVIAGVVFVLMTLLILLEVILRAFFGASTLVAGEYSGYALSAMIYLSLGFSFKEGAHIRITFLKDRISGWPAWILEILCTLFAGVLCGASAIFMWEMFLTSKARNLTAYTVAETPLYVPQFIVFLGMAVLTLQLAAHFLYIVTLGPRGSAQETTAP